MGANCGRAVVARELCARHYQQDTRGRLGKTKTIAAPGEAAEIKVTTGAALKTWLEKSAKRARVSVSAYARMLLDQARNGSEG